MATSQIRELAGVLDPGHASSSLLTAAPTTQGRVRAEDIGAVPQRPLLIPPRPGSARNPNGCQLSTTVPACLTSGTSSAAPSPSRQSPESGSYHSSPGSFEAAVSQQASTPPQAARDPRRVSSPPTVSDLIRTTMDEVQERFIDTSFPNLIQETSQNAPVEAVTDLPGAHIPLLPPPPPYGYRVEGAGTTEADGLYVRDGEYCGAPLFKKGRLWLLRYRLQSGNLWWYIADKDNLDKDDGDLYRIKCVAPEDEDLPPAGSKWLKAKDGALPAPTFTLVQTNPDAAAGRPAVRIALPAHLAFVQALCRMLWRAMGPAPARPRPACCHGGGPCRGGGGSVASQAKGS